MRRFGVSAVAALVGVVAICIVYAAHVVHRGFSTRSPPSEIEATVAMSVRDMAIPPRYKELTSSLVTTPQAVHDGMAHYADHCAICHANNGSGETTFGATMYPRPPNLAGADTQSMSDGELYYTIENGVRLSGMPAFGEGGDDDEDSWKLVAFLRHLPKLTPAEEAQMETLDPKSPQEFQEEQVEERFLNGGDASNQIATPHHSKGHHP